MSEILKKSGRDTVTGEVVDIDIAVETLPDGRKAEAVVAEIEKIIFRDLPAGDVLAFSGINGASSVYGSGITATLIYVVVTTPGFFAVGEAPDAALDTALYLPANLPTIVQIVSGDTISVVNDGTAGNLYFHPVA